MRKVSTIYKLTAVAMLTALATALSFLTVQIPLGSFIVKQFSVSLVCLYLVTMKFGPLYGMASGFITDLLSTLFNPAGGAYNPAFSVVYFLAPPVMWLFFSVIFRKVKRRWISVPVTVAVTQILVFWPINSFMISCFFSTKGFWAILASRSVSLLIEIPVFAILIIAILPLMDYLQKEINKDEKSSPNG